MLVSSSQASRASLLSWSATRAVPDRRLDVAERDSQLKDLRWLSAPLAFQLFHGVLERLSHGLQEVGAQHDKLSRTLRRLGKQCIGNGDARSTGVGHVEWALSEAEPPA